MARVAAVKWMFVLFLGIGTALAEPGDPENAPSDPDYSAGVAALEAREWKSAIRFLSSAALRDTRNADIQNYLGFAHRNTGELSLAFKHYSRALQLNPRHRGAHEYLGEAYLMVGNPAKAEEHLTVLKHICLIPCPETRVLEQKIAQYKKSH